MASGTIKAVVGRSDIVDNLTTNDATKVLSAKQGKALKDAVDTLNSKLTPTDYTTTGLNGNYCTFDRGGYCRIGNLVIVNIRVNISGSGANITGFPAPKNIIGFGGYDGISEKSAFGYMNTSGSLVIPTAYGNSGAVMFSFAYIT